MTWLDDLRAGGKPALAHAITELERRPDAPDLAANLDVALSAPMGCAIGLTGPPGAGKSSLIDALFGPTRARGLRIGVIAVDPSSRKSGGALLGDRTRFGHDPEDAGIFVRSMAARDRLGGVADLTYPAMVLMRAVFDLVLIETVGIGQSETEIADLADLTVFCAQPGSGDALQFMKAGVMETPDIVLVTKADMHALAHRTVSDLRGALSLSDGNGVPVIPVSATEGKGIDATLDAMTSSLDRPEQNRRMAQAYSWVSAEIRSEFGRFGLARAASVIASEQQMPFSLRQALFSRLCADLSGLDLTV